MTAVLPEPTATVVPELSIAGGLAGFPDAERFALVEVPEVPSLYRLSCLDEPGLEFVVAPPVLFFPDYAPEVDDGSAARLGLVDPEDALLLVVLTVRAGGDATANLLAPIVINQRTRQAAQVVVQGEFSLRAPVRAAR